MKGYQERKKGNLIVGRNLNIKIEELRGMKIEGEGGVAKLYRK